MTVRERVLAALRHKQPDRVPWQFDFTEKARDAMAAYYGDPQFLKKLGNCIVSLGVEPESAWREVRPHIFVDDFGVEWDRSVDKDIGVVCNTLVTQDTMRQFRFPDPEEPSRWKDYEPTLRERKKDALIVPGFGFSLFERAWTLAGMENVLTWMVTDKEFLHEFMDRILDYNLKIINRACSYGIDGMRFGDDWGQQMGLIMGPDLWREFIKPRVRQMYAAVKAKGKIVFIHSCGKVEEIFPDLIECGVEVFNPFQPEVMDVYEIKRKYGESLSFFGGISTQRTLPYGTPAQTREEVKRLVDKIGKGGGYIASPAHAIPADAKPENIAAMIEVLQNQ